MTDQGQRPILDVRTPAEFEKAHIPGAINFPLFSNEERHEVGLCYKTKGSDAAVKLGLEFVGPKLKDYVEAAEKIAPDKRVMMYCWRGGMRSGSLSWLLLTAGFDVEVIKGGYKTWRNQKLATIESRLPLINIGGYTGVGKTEILHALQAAGEQIIDLEAIANHRGSSFGNLGDQPSTEHFENLLGTTLETLDRDRWIWIEDESRCIGRIYLNYEFFQSMRSAPFVFVSKSLENRVDHLCELYGNASKQELIEAFERIRKRMGGQFVNEAIDYLEQGDLKGASKLALFYYDRTYQYSLDLRKPTFGLKLDATDLSHETIAEQLITWKNQNLPCTVTDRAAVVK